MDGGTAEKIELLWSDVESLADTVAERVQSSGYAPDLLLGITVGGLGPTVLLAKRLDVHDVTSISASSYSPSGEQEELRIWNHPESVRGKRVLIVDEIADSGKTLQKIVATIQAMGAADIRTAVLCIRSDKCTFRPDFFAKEVDRWVTFPWDLK